MTALRQAAERALDAMEYHVSQTRPIESTTLSILEIRQALESDSTEALMDSQYIAGVTAGWNAANSDDPNEKLREIHRAYEGRTKPILDRKKAVATDGAHHVVESEPVARTPQTCPDCAGSGANQNGSHWDCCDTCKGRKVI